jgi:hypothetical protein
MMKHTNFLNESLPHIDLPGEDPRLITLGAFDEARHLRQSLWVVLCQRFRRHVPEIWMSYQEVSLSVVESNGTSSTRAIELKLGTLANINYNLESQGEQKNWSPFAVNGSEGEQQQGGKGEHLLYIQSMDPHRIVKIVKTNYPQHVFGESLPLGNRSYANLSAVWPFGCLRGGTPALFIPHDNHYLTFFHSSNHPPPVGDVLQTYIMGAYTFCPTSPFHILKMSSQPITHRTFYSGNWTNLPLSFYHIDYVIFPMSFIIEGNTVYLTYGKQDKEGWLIKLDYRKLMDSLSVINISC